jgi:hypothetical protein
VVSLRAAASTTDHCVVTNTRPRAAAPASDAGADESVVFTGQNLYQASPAKAIQNGHVAAGIPACRRGRHPCRPAPRGKFYGIQMAMIIPMAIQIPLCPRQNN